MFKLLLLKVKMRRIDIPVSEIERHFQTFSGADEGVGVFVCVVSMRQKMHPVRCNKIPQ